ncbi:MAG: hypothetical protein ABI370_09555 [Gammaproteobacteria bacterium]
MKGRIGTVITSLILSFFNTTHATEPTRSIVTPLYQKTTSTQANEILGYINKKLQDAGFPKDAREYILNVSKQQIAANPKPPNFDQELIDKNISMLIENLKIKGQKSSLISKQIYVASKYEKPWEYLTTASSFELFNSKSVFSDTTPLAIEEAIKKICPIFPFCQSPTKPKKK